MWKAIAADAVRIAAAIQTTGGALFNRIRALARGGSAGIPTSKRPTIRPARAAAALLAFSLLPASGAAAYDSVCMQSAPGLAYAGNFRVIWGVPEHEEVKDKANTWGFPLEGSRYSRGFESRGASDWSSPVSLGNGRSCVELREVRDGERFVVEFQISPAASFPPHLCYGWESNFATRYSTGVMTQNADREGRSLMMHAWGPTFDPSCRFVAVEDNPS